MQYGVCHLEEEVTPCDDIEYQQHPSCELIKVPLRFLVKILLTSPFCKDIFGFTWICFYFQRAGDAHVHPLYAHIAGVILIPIQYPVVFTAVTFPGHEQFQLESNALAVKFPSYH